MLRLGIIAIGGLCATLCLTGAAAVTSAPVVYVNEALRVKLSIPEFEKLGPDADTLVAIFGGPRGSQIQISVKPAATAEALRERLKKQYAARGGVINTESADTVQGRDALFLETLIRGAGQDLYQLDRAVCDKAHVILITASAPGANYGELREQLAACLMSLTFRDPSAGPPKSSDPRIFEHEELGLVLTLPATEPTPLDSATTLAQFFGPRDGALSPNVNIQSQAPADIEKYVDDSEKSVAELGGKMPKQERRTVQGRPALYAEMEFVVPGTSVRAMCLTLVVFDKERTYQVTCTATPRTYEAMRDRFTACVESFQLIEEPR